MHFTKLSKYDYLSRVDGLFSASLKDERIRKAVYSFGYTEQRLDQGRSLYKTLNDLEKEHESIMASKAALNHQKQELQKYVNKQYMKFLKIARIAFDNHIEAQESLMLNGIRERVFGKWYAQVSLFCNNIISNKEYWPYLEDYGVKITAIEDLKKQHVQLGLLSDKVIQVTGSLKMLTSKKKEQTILVQEWVSDYIKIARIALEDAPQNLKKLGIGVKNSVK